jgi:zinc transporter
MSEIDENKALLFALELDGKGGARELDERELVKRAAPCWLHFNAALCESPEYLAQFAEGLDTESAANLLEVEARPRCLEIEDCVLLNLRGVNFNQDENHEDMVAIRLWIESDTLISSRYRVLESVQEVRRRLLKGNGPTSISELVTLLCSRMLERMDPVLSSLDDDTDQIEERIIEKVDTELRKDCYAVPKLAGWVYRTHGVSKKAMIA